MGGGPDAPASDRFIALYLPEASSDRDLQRKTILMPACEYRPDRVLRMLSTTREIRIRCKDALEQQADFVWASFEPVDA